ncbi:MAG: hypothetical protein GTO14_17810 [Anaerolineales bacterium]|nr:hypothetical protein [Anaerolineales bacterium]
MDPKRSIQFIRFCTVAILFAVVLLSLFASHGIAGSKEGPNRKQAVVLRVTEHQWWLVSWEDDQIVCQVYVDHDDLPKYNDIYWDCGEDVFELWQESEPCTAASDGGDTSSCVGFYLHYAGSQNIEREVFVDLPPPTVWISLEGCEVSTKGYRCQEPPILILTAEEPLEGEYITSIEADLDGKDVGCEADTCQVQLAELVDGEAELTFWAESSYGDESEHYDAVTRTLLIGRNEGQLGKIWHVDVLSSQWLGEPVPACALSFGAFPPIEPLPAWLVTPESVAGLSTDEPYELLAGRLLRWGFIESGCPYGGLMANGMASNCGVDDTRDFVDAWQDRFDDRIFEMSLETEVPAILIKNVFAQESQFWPGGFPNIKEYGLGSLHAQGGDGLLLWNISFYNRFCPTVLSDEACEDTYPELDEVNQELLRGALTIQANVSCPECPGGFDLDKAERSVDIFAQLLRAGCDQVGQTVWNITGERPGSVSSYEDLWRFLLVNYNAGPGCLAGAMDEVWDDDLPLDWGHVSEALSDLEACDAAVEYVENVTGK